MHAIHQQCLDMPPKLSTKIALFEVNADILRQVSRLEDCRNITSLNFHGAGIQKNGRIGWMSQFEVSPFYRLTILLIYRASKVFPSSKSSMSATTILAILRSSHRCPSYGSCSYAAIAFLQRIQLFLSQQSPQLIDLDLSGNPVCDTKGYRRFAVSMLASLKKLDSKFVTKDERDETIGDDSVVDLEWIRKRTKPTQSKNDAIELSQWAESVEQLDLNCFHIRRVCSLQQLINLRRASFSDNEIERIEGIESCTLLEELCFDENRIRKIEGLASLVFLKKLDLGHNMIRSIDCLDYACTPHAAITRRQSDYIPEGVGMSQVANGALHMQQ